MDKRFIRTSSSAHWAYYRSALRSFELEKRENVSVYLIDIIIIIIAVVIAIIG